ncbi:MAG TPA: DUF1800 domain-containing protein [Terriglobales bacterium]|jgi:uncharacterized protein (DUF1800 family)|nr:DUF1800 domain-containing protein [Terriglobales bacterium]
MLRRLTSAKFTLLTKFTFLLIVLALSLGASVLIGADKKKKSNKASEQSSAAASIPQMDEEKRALHVLNRLTFGPRPGDVDLVSKMGVDQWIEQQLHPDTIDDSAVGARLAPLRTLNMSTKEIVESFPTPQTIQAIATGRMDLPSDPTKRAIYEAAVANYKAAQERKNDNNGQQGNLQAAATQNQQGNQQAEDANGPNPTMADPNNSNDMAAKARREERQEARMYAELKGQEILDMQPDQRYDAIMKLSPEERQAMLRSFNNNNGDRQQLLNDLSPQQRETLMALTNPQQVVALELQEGKILRAAYSERQLEEVMTDFWFNHFNVFINKGPDRYLITSYERDVIRPHVFGKFKDLLLATAQSPAMLFYLDNWQSVGPNSDVAQGRGGKGKRRRNFRRAQNQAKNKSQQQQRRGLNENYAREIMELHTLGVDGGYTQKDVTELARILTGWTIDQPRLGGDFVFNERWHEPGKKTFLGQTFKEGGQKEGERAIELLAKNPSTAKFISRKLAMRFVSDTPPQALVDRMAQTFLKSDGDIREVLRIMFKSPEFWSADSYRAKVKTPLEFVVSSIRATNADVTNVQPLVQTLNRMGMPLYGMQPPTGYSMKQDAWVNSSALLDRMNFALALGGGRLNGIQIDPQHIFNGTAPQDAATAQAALEQALLAGDVSAQTHQTIGKQLSDPQVTGRRLDDPSRPPNVGVIAGLILGSPEFQRR